MSGFAAARRHMVDSQIRTSDVTDRRLLAAMLDVPRERFTPAAFASVAYLDLDLPAGEAADAASRRLLKPMVLARLIAAAAIADTDRVLDVGCASGYSTAVLARLAQSVVALEDNAALAARAKDVLGSLPNVSLIVGPLSTGWPAAAPYDVILLNGATEIVPDALCGQLADAGRLVCILGSGPSGKAMIYRRAGNSVAGRAIFDAAAPVLPGFVRPQEFAF